MKRRTPPPRPYLPPQRRTRPRLSHRPHPMCKVDEHQRSLLHRAVEGPVVEDRTSGLPASCCCRRGGLSWGVAAAGRVAAGAGPGRCPPTAAWRITAVLLWCGPLPRAGVQLTVHVSTGGLPLVGLTRGCLRVSPGGRPHTVAARRGCPPVGDRRRLCAGFR